MINSVTSDFAHLLFKYDGLQSHRGKSTKVTLSLTVPQF